MNTRPAWIGAGITRWGSRTRRRRTILCCSRMEGQSRWRNDAESRSEIQQHLGHIVTMFRNNDFEIPMLIHDRVPPGVPEMKQKRDVISYSYAPTERGGQVRIKTADPEALKAIHDFLIFQIRDHRTGDSEEIRKAS